jgi:hypothetical protein
MSKPLAGFYGQKSISRPPQSKPQEYTILGVNQPIIAPESEQVVPSPKQPLPMPPQAKKHHKFRFSLLLNKLL